MKIRHFEANRMLLLLIGLWPYQRSKLVQFQFILLLGLLITFIMFEFETFLTSRRSMDLIFKILFSIFTFTTIVIIYVSFGVCNEAVKSFLDRLRHIYDELKDENEIAIVDKYGRKTKRYVIMLTMVFTFCLFWIFLIQLWPSFLDVVLPKNKTRPFPQIEVVTEYILQRESYFYFLLHINAVFCVSAYVALGTSALVFTCGQHICGMFRIARYRIRCAMSMDMLQSINPKKETLICKGIICAIDIHRKGMQLAEYFVSKFMLWLSMIAVFGIITLSLNLLRIFQKILSGCNFEEIVVLLASLIIVILYMFLVNYSGQGVMDYNNHFFAAVYDGYWYLAPLYIQRIVLFLLQRGVKPFNLVLSGLFVASLEGFAMLVSTSISYFTVIYSTRR